MVRFPGLRLIFVLLLVPVLVVPALAAPEEEGRSESVGVDEELPAVSEIVSDPVASVPFPNVIDVRIVSDTESDYLPPDEFFAAYGDDYSIETYALQTSPTSPVTADSANGFKKVILSLFGDYSPVITQYRYQSNTSTNYTYVNDIQLDYPWLVSAGIFSIVLYCIFRLGGSVFCKK